jgi:Ca2+-binding RTX toxin-like protein
VFLFARAGDHGMAQRVVSTKISVKDGNALFSNTDDDDYRVTLEGVVESVTGDGIKAWGSNHDVIVEGSVSGRGSGIALGGLPGNSGNTVTVEATGLVTNTGTGFGVYVSSSDASVVNRGTITSKVFGVAIINEGPGTATCDNSGTIRGQYGVYVDSEAAFDFVNSGRVKSKDDWAFVASDGNMDGVGDVTVTNTGTLVGHVIFAAGNDIYDGSQGIQKHGNIEGRGGDDRLTGGDRGEIFRGGLGMDILTGGSGEDTFLYKDIADSSSDLLLSDVITDFSRADGDIIDLSAIDAKQSGLGTKEVGKDSDFTFIGDTDFHGRKGEIRFFVDNGVTVMQGDVDGDGDSDLAVTLTGEITLKASDFEL